MLKMWPQTLASSFLSICTKTEERTVTETVHVVLFTLLVVAATLSELCQPNHSSWQSTCKKQGSIQEGHANTDCSRSILWSAQTQIEFGESILFKKSNAAWV